MKNVVQDLTSAGLEWKRSKWSAPAKAFLRYCEKCLVENSDLAICDSVNIEKYIKDTYGSRVKDMKVTYRWCKDAKL